MTVHRAATPDPDVNPLVPTWAEVVLVAAIFVALVYIGLKIAFWNEFELGLAPLVVGLFFFGSVQLFFIGILGEYIGAIHTQVLKRPHVVELERINF